MVGSRVTYGDMRPVLVSAWTGVIPREVSTKIESITPENRQC